MRKILICGIIVISIAMAGCQKKKQVAPAPSASPAQEAPKRMFAPAADSSVTAEQLKLWTACNSPLDTLSIAYQDSFKAPDPSTRVRLQADFTRRQDQICKQAGLAGYEEYRWIMSAMGNPRNKPVLEQTGLTVK